jgi:hypothetical protein
MCRRMTGDGGALVKVSAVLARVDVADRDVAVVDGLARTVHEDVDMTQTLRDDGTVQRVDGALSVRANDRRAGRPTAGRCWPASCAARIVDGRSR